MEISIALSISFVRDLGRFQAQAGLLRNPGDKVQPRVIAKEAILPTCGCLECCEWNLLPIPFSDQPLLLCLGFDPLEVSLAGSNKVLTTCLEFSKHTII